MVKLTILYNQPKDPAEFERYYSERHVPDFIQAGVLRNLVRFDARKGLSRGQEAPPFYRLADLWWASAEAMAQDLQSPAGQAGTRDVQNLATGGYAVMLSEVETQEFAKV